MPKAVFSALGARLIISTACELYLNSHLLHNRRLSATIMSLVPQPHSRPCSEEQQNVDSVQDKIGTERDIETR